MSKPADRDSPSWLADWRRAWSRRRRPASRSYRYLARMIELEYGRHDPGVALALGSTEDDAASAAALLMLAYSLNAELGSRVLVIDARFKAIAQGVTGRLGLEDRPGLTDLMGQDEMGIEDFVCPTAVAGVDVVPAGNAPAVTLAAWDRMRFAAVLGQAKSGHDIVLMQIGPVLADTRNLLVATQADAVLLFALQNETLVKSLVDSQKLLRTNGMSDVRIVVS